MEGKMAEMTIQDLDGVAETLLIPLHIRGLESLRPDALLKDARAEELVKRLGKGFDRIRQLKIDETDKVTIILRNREFDRLARDFLSRHPGAAVVHIGCGLDSRFERVDNGLVEWFDLDLPEVIELRKKLLGGECERHHVLPFSAFDGRWLKNIDAFLPRPLLILAEGIFMYFEKDQVKSLVTNLAERFPGAELAFDGFSPFVVRANNRRISRTKMGARFLWALKNGKDLESWGAIHLLGEWRVFDRPEPRLAKIRWLRFIPLVAKAIGIYRYQLGG
jgi:O-methyltransferase involved in polyketide biosynthesis